MSNEIAKARTIARGFAVLLLLIGTTNAKAYYTYSYRLPVGNFVFEVSLGAFDATTAMAQWNPYLGTSHLSAVNVVGNNFGINDGISEICWASDYSLAPPESRVIAYNYPVVDWTSGIGMVTEDDIVLNNVTNPFGWGSYNGYNGERFYDVNRILLHELGHALGLGHQIGTIETGPIAIMNPSPTKLWQLQPDDIAGAQAIYGRRSSQVPDTGESVALLGIGLLVLGLVRKEVK